MSLITEKIEDKFTIEGDRLTGSLLTGKIVRPDVIVASGVDDDWGLRGVPSL